MIKPVVFAAAVLVCAPLVSASTSDTVLALAPAVGSEACHAAALDAGCSLHVGDPSVPASLALAAAEPAELSDTGLDFKDAAQAPSTIVSTHEHDSRKPLVPALMALLAMVVLLGRRPTAF